MVAAMTERRARRRPEGVHQAVAREPLRREPARGVGESRGTAGEDDKDQGQRPEQGTRGGSARLHAILLSSLPPKVLRPRVTSFSICTDSALDFGAPLRDKLCYAR